MHFRRKYAYIYSPEKRIVFMYDCNISVYLYIFVHHSLL